MFRPVIYIFVSLALYACDFAPANTAENRRALAQIHVAPIAERQGQMLKTALVRQFDPNGSKPTPVYRLDLNLVTHVVTGFEIDAGVRRARGTMTATGRLARLDGSSIWQGSFSRSSFLAQHDLPSLSLQAQEELWLGLADQIAREAAIEFGRALSRANAPIAVP